MADTRPLIPEGCVCFGRTAEWASRAITFCPVCDKGDPRCPQPTQPAQEWKPKAGETVLVPMFIHFIKEDQALISFDCMNITEPSIVPLSSLRPLPGKEGGR